MSVRFSGGWLWRDDELHRLATYRGERWELAGEYFEDIAVDERVMVYFQSGPERRSQDYGPFAHFETRDGVAYCGDEIFARYSNDENTWVHEKSGLHWEAMVLRRAVR